MDIDYSKEHVKWKKECSKQMCKISLFTDSPQRKRQFICLCSLLKLMVRLACNEPLKCSDLQGIGKVVYLPYSEKFLFFKQNHEQRF